MISVKDQEVMQKREAFLYTINQHKHMANSHQNAVFSSAKTRFDPTRKDEPQVMEAPAATQASGGYQTIQPSQDLNKTGRGAFDSSERNITQSTFGLSF
jgi:hypothetical protein